MRFRATLFAFACALAVAPALAEEKKTPLQLPVTSVTIYSGGSTCIEHRGAVHGNATFELRVKPSQLTAALKTLVVQDGPDALPAASIEPLDAPTTQPTSHRLDLSLNPSLVEILQQLRGAKVKLAVPGGELQGAVLSLENAGSDGQDVWRLNVLAANAIRSIPMSDVQRIELADPRDQQDLARALDSLWQDPDDTRRTIAVHLRGAGERAVTIAYTLDAVPWKPSYKLLTGDKPILQSWATVANQTDQPWNNIQLNLVSHQPFTGGALDGGTVSRAAKATGVPAGESFRKPKPPGSRDALDNIPDAAPAPHSTSTSLAPPIDPKSLFRQTASNVTIPPRASLLVPLSAGPTTVQHVAVFNESLLKRNALQGAILRNSPHAYLVQGPVTLIADGEYAGEAPLENLAPSRSTLLAWSIDLGIIVDASRETHTLDIAAARIADGVLHLDRTHLLTRQYLIDNESRTDCLIVVEHPIRRGWSLVAPAKDQLLESSQNVQPSETLHRIPLTVKAGATATLIVKEQSPEGEAIELATAAPQTLADLARDKHVPPAVAKALTQAAALRQDMIRQEQDVQDKLARFDRLAAEQARVRENLKALPEADPVRARQVEKLESLDKQLTDLRQSIDAASQSLTAAREQALKSLASLTAG